MKKIKIIGSMILLMMTFVLTGCSDKNAEGDKKVRIAYFPNITHSQAMIMKSQGTFEEKIGEDYEVSWTSFNAGPAEVEALFAGEIDLGYIGPVPAINAYVKSKGDLQIIAGVTNAGAVLVSRSDLVLTDLKELDQKKVAIPQLGNTQHLSLLNLLSENGLAPTTKGGTVEVTAVANADIKALMDKKELDAALVPEPWGSILINDIQANLVLDATELWRDGDYSTAVVIVSKDFEQKNPELVKQFIECHKDATVYVNENLEEAKKIVNEEITKAVSKPIEDDILDSAFSRLIFSSDISVDSIKAFAELNLQEDFIKELPDDQLTNESYLKEQ